MSNLSLKNRGRARGTEDWTVGFLGGRIKCQRRGNQFKWSPTGRDLNALGSSECYKRRVQRENPTAQPSGSRAPPPQKQRKTPRRILPVNSNSLLRSYAKYPQGFMSIGYVYLCMPPAEFPIQRPRKFLIRLHDDMSCFKAIHVIRVDFTIDKGAH